MDIGLFLKEKRENLKIPRWQIAKKLNISPEALRDIEHGKTRMSLENFLIICKELNLSPLELLKDSKDHYAILNNTDLKILDQSIDLLKKIRFQTQNTFSNNSNNITVGDGNTITNSFNRNEDN